MVSRPNVCLTTTTFPYPRLSRLVTRTIPSKRPARVAFCQADIHALVPDPAALTEIRRNHVFKRMSVMPARGGIDKHDSRGVRPCFGCEMAVVDFPIVPPGRVHAKARRCKHCVDVVLKFVLPGFRRHRGIGLFGRARRIRRRRRAGSGRNRPRQRDAQQSTNEDPGTYATEQRQRMVHEVVYEKGRRGGRYMPDTFTILITFPGVRMVSGLSWFSL